MRSQESGVRSLKLEPSRNYRELVVWQKAHRFVLETYAYTERFPKQETYGLVSQLRRAAISIPANIAEGYRRRGRADKARLLNIAEGSISECSYYLLLAADLGYGDSDALTANLEEVSRILHAYTSRLLTPRS